MIIVKLGTTLLPANKIDSVVREQSPEPQDENTVQTPVYSVFMNGYAVCNLADLEISTQYGFRRIASEMLQSDESVAKVLTILLDEHSTIFCCDGMLQN